MSIAGWLALLYVAISLVLLISTPIRAGYKRRWDPERCEYYIPDEQGHKDYGYWVLDNVANGFLWPVLGPVSLIFKGWSFLEKVGESAKHVKIEVKKGDG